MSTTTDNQRNKAKEHLNRQDSDREESENQRKYLDRTRQPKQSNSSRGDFDKIENLFFDIGYWSTKGSIDFSVGMISGILAGIKDMAFGCVEVIKNTKNPIIQSRSKEALLNSATNDLPENEKENLAKGIKIGDDEYRKTASSIDSLYRENDSLKNDDDSIEIGEYTFQLKEIENGDRQYVRSRTNPEIGRRVEVFILDGDRNVIAINNTFSKEDNTESLGLISSLVTNHSQSQVSRIENTEATKVEGQELINVASKVDALATSIDSITPSVNDPVGKRLEVQRELLSKNVELIDLQLEVNKLSSAIEDESTNSSNNGSKSIHQGLNKLFAINKAIQAISTTLLSKQSMAASLDTIRLVKAIDSTIEQAESSESTKENTSNEEVNQGNRGTDIATTPIPIESGWSEDVDESEIDYGYNPF